MATPKKKKAGRRGKYEEWITEEGLAKVAGWARDGLIEAEIAAKIGIAESTLNVWKNRFPEFSDTLKSNKEVVDRKVEATLLKRALGYEYEETETIVEEGGDGGSKRKVRRVKKHVAADTTAAIFWLKNRKPQEWRDRHHQEHSGSIDMTHQFEDLTDDELNELANKYADVIEEEPDAAD